ncbi:MAG: sulfite exporter TauE/SafE family protein [Ignavibacteria bacterium]|nr:sulfite exporter TauE/SafE family protein [Ignavibacteria bacterium]
MTIVLYVIAVFIGITLGMIGAGGAIVAVPSFVYLGGIPPALASGYALFVVAVASAVGAVQYIRNKLVDWRAVFAFGSSTLVTIALTRGIFLPAIPDIIPLPFGGTITEGSFLMFAFSGVLLYAAISMLRQRKKKDDETHPTHFLILAAYGVIIGLVSGFLGVGGGFLMTPALVLWANLEMKRAVGTSLVLISVNSLVGVGADITAGVQYEWGFLLVFTVLTTIGIIFGGRFATRVDGAILRKGFGWLVLAIGVSVLARESFNL